MLATKIGKPRQMLGVAIEESGPSVVAPAAKADCAEAVGKFINVKENAHSSI